LQVATGSITGGGRYDDLTGIFGLPNMSGVGISFGIERIYDVWTELNQNQTALSGQSSHVMLVNFGGEEELYSLKTLKQLRTANISAELYPDSAKLQKQMKYANAKNIPFIILAGENEMKQHQFTVKNMQTGEQKTVTFDELISIITK
jgi:histidyl-tRNA synthetase